MFENITNYYSNAATIAFSTSGWQSFSFEQQLVEELLIQIKQEREARKSKWRVSFIFSDEQSELYDKFNKAMKRLRSDEDRVAQYSSPLTSKWK